jgi:hypothetical protein
VSKPNGHRQGTLTMCLLCGQTANVRWKATIKFKGEVVVEVEHVTARAAAALAWHCWDEVFFSLWPGEAAEAVRAEAERALQSLRSATGQLQWKVSRDEDGQLVATLVGELQPPPTPAEVSAYMAPDPHLRGVDFLLSGHVHPKEPDR